MGIMAKTTVHTVPMKGIWAATATPFRAFAATTVYSKIFATVVGRMGGIVNG
jgi:hypothetical protein